MLAGTEKSAEVCLGEELTMQWQRNLWQGYRVECEDLKLLGYSKVAAMGQHLVQRFITDDFSEKVDDAVVTVPA